MTTAAQQNLNEKQKNGQWIEISNYFNDLDIQVDRDDSVRTEMERAIKLKAAIATIFIQLDADFVPSTVLKEFDVSISNAYAQLDQFKKSATADYLKNVNDWLAQAYLSLKRCLHSSPSDLQHLSSAVLENKNLLVKIFKEGADEITEEARTAKKSLTELKSGMAQIKAAHEAILKLQEELLSDTDARTSISTNIRSMEKAVEGNFVKVNEYAKELFDENQEGGSTSKRVNGFVAQIKETMQESSLDFEKFQGMLKDIEDFHSKVFGTALDENFQEENKESDGVIRGNLLPPNELKMKIEWFARQAEILKATSEKSVQELLNKINSLISGATSAGLASAFEAESKKQDNPKKQFTWLFITSLLGMAVAALSTMFGYSTPSPGLPEELGFIRPENIEAAFRDVLFRLPMIVPLIWLAIFSARRRSDCERLQQEYIHKAALAKSYDSYKQQLDALPPGNEDLKKELLETMIKAISKNASDSLEPRQKPVGLLQSWLASKVINRIES